MCVNMRWVKNPYTRQNLFVPCRQCPSCQQEQANRRAQRIRNNQREDCVSLFCTLTYDNDTVPYVRKEDLLFVDSENPVINIYRDFNVRRVRCDENYRIVKSKRKNGEVISMPLSSFEVDIDTIPELTNKPGCVGVCLYSDVQKFFKRLKINLIRRYHVPEYIKYDYFACTEYGSETSRPHVHALIQCPREYEDILRLAVNESWDFDLSLPRKVEVARDASDYVASYCNKCSSLHPFFKIPQIRQNHSYSQGYGMALRSFSLAEILRKADRRNLTYDIIKQDNGTPVRASIPIPKYVVNRFFPNFLGRCRLNYNEIHELLTCAQGYSTIQVPQKRKYYQIPFHGLERFGERIGATKEQVRQLSVKLYNSYCRYKEHLPSNTLEQYANDYLKVWKAYESTRWHLFYDNLDVPWFEMYDNIDAVWRGKVKAPTLLPLMCQKHDLELNPNKFQSRISRTLVYDALYYKKLTSKRVANVAMSHLGYNV